MNERIEKLISESIKAIPDHVDFDLPKEFTEKFAELIVLECASQVRFTDLLLCNDDSDGEILLQASVQLKQHFGVE